ncbi:disease resistance protein RGA2-like isoform X2 [Punica granatum]|nr:disease resistance protein RGA2-like isoform X2 [Punica granatum]
MAEPILQGFTQSLLDKIVSLVAEEVSLAWAIKDELRKLQRTLVSIRVVIADAEQWQFHEHKLRVWLEDLKDVLYDTENVLDEFECEAQRKQVIKHGHMLGKTRHFFSCSNPLAFRLKVGHKIKEIRMRLNEITAEKDAFNLNQQTNFSSGSRSIWRETHSRVNVSEIIGRDRDRDVIVKRLLCPDEDKNPYIVSIVGIGGIGKTALAKLVYNDDRVKLHFDSKIWVCVSEEFDLKIILQKIVKSVAQEPTTIQSIHLLELEQLQAKLQELLQDKKFLLVLDDVWSNNRRQWRELRDLLTGGTTGSSVIMTTRSLEVTYAGGSLYDHKLKGLSQGDSISILKKVLEERHGSMTNPELLEIASQIIDKCGGVPLVVKALGGLFCSNPNIRYWRSIVDEGILAMLHEEGDILPIIRLSYDHLPVYLKRLFAFCSLFPKDYVFNNLELREYWKASGLISTSHNNPEETCHHFIKELFARSFFQDFEEHGQIFTFKMHDIVHDLALSIAQNEYLALNSDTASISDRVRHLSFFARSNNPLVRMPQNLKQAKKLQTLLSLERAGDARLPKEFLKACISNCKYLRVLDLGGLIFELLPSDIDSLKHLRYLDLSRNPKIKRLPKSICNLQSLQYLFFNGCENLEELPRDMWKLINLRTLGIMTKEKSLKNSGIEHLKSLRELWIGGCNNLETLFEGINMEGLASLHLLSICNCESLTSIPMSSLKFLTSLEVLTILNCRKLHLSMEEEIFFSCLRTLVFIGLPKMLTFPKWVQGAGNTLQSLSIRNCQQLGLLPEWLHKLSCLEALGILGCDGISTLPDGVQDLTALRVLRISNCSELGGRCRPNGPDWHKIAHIPDIEIDGEKVGTSCITVAGSGFRSFHRVLQATSVVGS